MNEYEEEFMTTYIGIKFHYRNPVPDEVCIEDIAHHLSLLCRFTGACKVFYSVAEHSVRVAELVPPRLKLSALLHDAAEAYTNDIASPVKYSHKLDETEKAIMDVIITKYHITPDDVVVEEADHVLVATEARDLMHNTDDWRKLPEPLTDKIFPWEPSDAEASFLTYFRIWGNDECR